MTFYVAPSRNRRAALAPLSALLMTFMAGMLAFSIDIGYICSVQAELQDAADAAALAGVQQLQNPYVAYTSPGQTQQLLIYNTATTDTTNPTSPIPTAQQYASYNQAGGVYIKVPTSDISFQYYDGTTFSSPSFTSGLFPNTVTVTTRRDNNANGALGLFFAPIFGISTINLTATASATMYAGDITGLKVPQSITNSGGSGGPPSLPAHILPVALDVNVWFNYANGNLTSPWVLGVTSLGPNGSPQLQVYPTGTNTPGSFGLIDVGVPSNSTPAFRNWIDDGDTPNDINYLVNNNLVPVSPSAPQPWKCGPGLTSTLLSNFQSVMGQPNLIPLFVQVSPAPTNPPPSSPGPSYVAETGTGQNATYAVIGFVGVTITQATGSGSNMNISIQPAAISDPSAVIMNASPARVGQPSVFSAWQTSSSSGTSQTTGPTPTGFVSAKLTQ